MKPRLKLKFDLPKFMSFLTEQIFCPETEWAKPLIILTMDLQQKEQNECGALHYGPSQTMTP